MLKSIATKYENDVSDKEIEFSEDGVQIRIGRQNEKVAPILRDSLEKIKQNSESYIQNYFEKIENDSAVWGYKFIKIQTSGILWWKTTKYNCSYCSGDINVNIQCTYYPAKEYKSPPLKGKDLRIVLNEGYVFSANIQIFCVKCKQSLGIHANPVMCKRNFRSASGNDHRWYSYVSYNNEDDKAISFGSVPSQRGFFR